MTSSNFRPIVSLKGDSLRGITPRDPGPVPEIRWVKPTDLFVEDGEGGYQRAMESGNSIAMVRKIVHGFDWSHFKVPACSYVEEIDALVLVDGQHTTSGAASNPHVPLIPVLVVPTKSLAMRAKAFVGHNRNRIGLTQMAIFKAELAAGDQIAQMIDRACQAAGAKVVTKALNLRQPTEPGVTIAVGALRILAEHHGEEMLRRVLTILTTAGRGPIKAAEIAGVRLAIENADGSIDGRLVEVVKSKSAERWMAEAQTMIADTNTAMPVALATMWRAALGLSRPTRDLKGSGNSATKALKPAKPPARSAETKAAAAALVAHRATKAAAPAQKLPPAPKPTVRAPSPAPAPPAPQPTAAMTAAPITRNGISVDPVREVIARGRRVLNLSPDEISLAQVLLRVSPALLPIDRIAPKVFGPADSDSAYRIGKMVERLNPRLEALGLKIRSVPKMGFALADL